MSSRRELQKTETQMKIQMTDDWSYNRLHEGLLLKWQWLKNAVNTVNKGSWYYKSCVTFQITEIQETVKNQWQWKDMISSDKQYNPPPCSTNMVSECLFDKLFRHWILTIFMYYRIGWGRKLIMKGKTENDKAEIQTKNGKTKRLKKQSKEWRKKVNKERLKKERKRKEMLKERANTEERDKWLKKKTLMNRNMKIEERKSWRADEWMTRLTNWRKLGMS